MIRIFNTAFACMVVSRQQVGDLTEKGGGRDLPPFAPGYAPALPTSHLDNESTPTYMDKLTS